MSEMAETGGTYNIQYLEIKPDSWDSGPVVFFLGRSSSRADSRHPHLQMFRRERVVRNKAFVMNFSGEDGVDVGKLKQRCWMLRVANGKKVKVILK